MAMFMNCAACEEGRHEDHVAVIKPPPRGGVGGDVCRCAGDCRERNVIWYVVRGKTTQMIPSAERAAARRAAGYEVDGPMTGDQARAAVLGHRLLNAPDAPEATSPFHCTRSPFGV